MPKTTYYDAWVGKGKPNLIHGTVGGIDGSFIEGFDEAAGS